jgi:hypothetical protein
MDAPRIFQINDYEWWVSTGSAEEVLACYVQETASALEGGQSLPRLLEDWELDVNTYWGEHGQTRSFREQLAIVTKQGVEMPCRFAAEV